jgi:hypothetical protein
MQPQPIVVRCFCNHWGLRDYRIAAFKFESDPFTVRCLCGEAILTQLLSTQLANDPNPNSDKLAAMLTGSSIAEALEKATLTRQGE